MGSFSKRLRGHRFVVIVNSCRSSIKRHAFQESRYLPINIRETLGWKKCDYCFRTSLNTVFYEGRRESLHGGKVMKVKYGDSSRERCACVLLAQKARTRLRSLFLVLICFYSIWAYLIYYHLGVIKMFLQLCIPLYELARWSLIHLLCLNVIAVF